MFSPLQSDNKITEALVLAGGLGSRLSKVVPGRQKVVAPILGEPFLARVLSKLGAEGISRVVLALGYLAEDALSAIEPFVPKDMTIVPSIESSPLGTGGAIRHALPLIESSTILVANGDSLIDYSLAGLVSLHQRVHASVTMVLCKVPDSSRYGSVNIDEHSRVLAFQEKLAKKNGPGIINAGVYLMSRDIIKDMTINPHSLELHLLPGLCRNGLYGLVTEKPFIDIGTPSDYARADNFFIQIEKKF
jgi:NDP-sugar pyrophosphorylase family protein